MNIGQTAWIVLRALATLLLGSNAWGQSSQPWEGPEWQAELKTLFTDQESALGADTRKAFKNWLRPAIETVLSPPERATLRKVEVVTPPKDTDAYARNGRPIISLGIDYLVEMRRSAVLDSANFRFGNLQELSTGKRIGVPAPSSPSEPCKAMPDSGAEYRKLLHYYDYDAQVDDLSGRAAHLAPRIFWPQGDSDEEYRRVLQNCDVLRSAGWELTADLLFVVGHELAHHLRGDVAAPIFCHDLDTCATIKTREQYADNYAVTLLNALNIRPIMVTPFMARLTGENREFITSNVGLPSAHPSYFCRTWRIFQVGEADVLQGGMVRPDTAVGSLRWDDMRGIVERLFVAPSQHVLCGDSLGDRGILGD